MADNNQRWNREQFNAMRGTPWEPIPGQPGSDVKSFIPNGDDTGIIPKKQGVSRPCYARRSSIYQEDVRINLPTDGCRGCKKAKNRRKHSARRGVRSEQTAARTFRATLTIVEQVVLVCQRASRGSSSGNYVFSFLRVFEFRFSCCACT